MFRFLKVNIYALIITVVAFFFVVAPTFLELERVFAQYHVTFIFLRFINALGLIGLIIWLSLRKANDFVFSLLAAFHIFYCVYSSWYLPMYEFAYFQGALALCFLSYDRRWIYPLTQVLGGLVFAISIWMQNEQGWIVPKANSVDYFIVTGTTVLLTMIVHRYAYQARLDKNALLNRYGIVGREATRLLHDVKGMLASPLLLAGGLLHRRDLSASPEIVEGLEQLHKNLENMQSVVYNLNRLVSQNEEKQKVGILSVISRSMMALGNRVSQVIVEFPEDRDVVVEVVKLESVFFNLFLNSIQAMELKKSKDTIITIEWVGDSLIYRDNIGPTPLKKDIGTSLGYILIESDLQSMGISFDYKLESTGLTFKLKLA